MKPVNQSYVQTVPGMGHVAVFARNGVPVVTYPATWNNHKLPTFKEVNAAIRGTK